MKKAALFTEFIQAQVEKSDANWIFIDKIKTRMILNECRAPSSKIYQDVPSPSDVSFENLPGSFVLKATNFASKKGIYPLIKLENDYLLNLFDKKISNKNNIIEELTYLIGNRKSRVIIEEFIQGEGGPYEIPCDYKFYTFESNILFILKIDRNIHPNSFSFFDGNFEPLDSGKVKVNSDHAQLGKFERPANWELMIDTACRVARFVDRPFISVDMYTNGNECFVGELTPGPGGPYFGKLFLFSYEFDLFLGSALISGYGKRGWPIPKIDTLPPCSKYQ